MAASTSYNRNPSSSTSPPATVWDVFLSFRGLDTRNTFTSHLYKDLCRNGIKTFMDDPELGSGEVISRALPHAIQESETYVVVLSENYASSPWCLDELVEILRCSKTTKRLVVPVFYYIDPYVVRHQIESFKEAFDKHQTRHDVEKLNNWRLTLKEVADISGYHVSRNRSEADIIDEVVSRILFKINPKTLHVATYPVGLVSRVEGITTLFNSDIEGVNRIVIHGMGGVGKTTLAKAVYNQLYKRFHGSCFLANVREVSSTEQGLVRLQKQLINDVLRRKDADIDSVDQGLELIRIRICRTKVLLVIDDIDDPKPLKYLDGQFASGSMVIITTRNEGLLEGNKVTAKFRVDLMDKDESLQLFTQHAFGEDQISDPFTELSKEIIERAGGLPLALQVFGSTLLNKSEEEWRWFIDKLKRASINDVEEKLMISFDVLKLVDPHLQDIFLDIACFYIGWNKEAVAKILETCYTFVNQKIGTLKKRSLITIDDEDTLGMHDLLQDMGRGIARNNSPDEPGKHSRLWVPEDIDTVLKNQKGTGAIRGIISGNFYYQRKLKEVTYFAEAFKRMSKLRFLYLNNVNLIGSCEQTFEDLRWLHWKHCPLECFPSEFYPQKLVSLELPYSKLRRMWERDMVFEKLKTLSMRNSKNLTTTPDFTRFLCLETLDLEGCSSLEEVHVSIGSLASLVSLDLTNCEKLRSLPGSICSLRALEVLTVFGCFRLEALPTDLGSIESLQSLNASGLSVSKLPDSIGRLSNAVELDLNYNNNLETLDISYRIGNSSLKHLKRLSLTNCEALKEIQGLEQVTSLEFLNLYRCWSLKRLPNLCNLKDLEVLNLGCCERLAEISKLPPNLKSISAQGCTSLKRLQNLSNLKQLEELDLTNCCDLMEIQGLEELNCLRELSLAGCNSSLLAHTLTTLSLSKLESLSILKTWSNYLGN